MSTRGAGAGASLRYVLHTPSLRSAHLERLVPLPHAGVALEVLATGRHPDCDDAVLARAPVPVVVAGREDAVAALRAAPPDVLEVTEPAWTAMWPLALRLAEAVRPTGTRVVTYAIDNRPPDAPVDGVDVLEAVVFGTADAAATYARVWPGTAWLSRVLEERRPRCGCLPVGTRSRSAAREVAFVAELSERKGVDVLQAAWPAVATAVPGWTLRLLGYGPRLGSVARWAASRGDVELVPRADRTAVHEALARAAVLVLPSRRTSQWREQVGLSLVEALAHGCAVVTTTETGLAAGLAAAGHEVVAPDDPVALADGLGRAMRGAGPRVDLPPASAQADSRLQAVAWLAGRAQGGR